MKIIYDKIDKTLIPEMPKVVFEGRIVVVVSADEARRAVDFLLTQPILGIDTETRPSFKRGITNNVSLLQVATHDVCFLFRLNYLGANEDIVRLLEDTTVPKIGLALRDDLISLRKINPFTPGLFIDLQKHVSEIGVKDMGLQKLYANFFSMRISKNQRLTNWETDVLKEKQKMYAAIDAWVCIKLYEELTRLKATGDYTLVTAETEDEK
ncbi:MAG: 3'-5' exonuclease domain-containing protein 2 [Prevotella sp.]|nr:3'-5' exonuclease domain-containing protein 2 [Prevotella sp.]